MIEFVGARIVGRQDVEMVFRDSNNPDNTITFVQDHWDHVHMVRDLLKLPFTAEAKI